MASPPGTAPGDISLDGVDIALLEPLERAAGTGDADATATILASGTTVPIGAAAADERPLRRSILHWASFGGNVAVVAAVLEAVVESGVAAAAETATAGGETPAVVDAALADAASAAKSDALEATCLSRVSGHDGNTPLHLAAEHGHVAAAMFLLEAGAVDTYLDDFYEPPLARAVRAGHEDLVAELLRRGSLTINDALDYGGTTAVHIAALKGHLGMVEMLLRQGAAVNVFTSQLAETPLHFAVRCGPNAEAVTLALLGAGADVDTCGPDNESALCKASDLAVMRALVLAGATPHWQEAYHRSPVEVAMKNDNVAELSMFLEAGMDPNHRGPFNTPLPAGASTFAWLAHHHRQQRYERASLLHRAARWLCAVAVEKLLAAGAREDIPAVTDAHQEETPAITTLPADVVGIDVKEMTPELESRAEAIRSMLAAAKLYRKGWLSVLRARFDAGESLTGRDGGGEGSTGGDWSDGVEGRSTLRQKNERGGGGSRDMGVLAVEEQAWYGAAVWIASVPGPEVFRIITEYL